MANMPPDAATLRLVELCRLYLRPPAGCATDDVTGFPVVMFDPLLTAPEQVIFDRIARLSKSLVEGITATEWQAIESDIAGLVTYQGLASPTLAQTVLAVKAQSRILRAIIRN